MNSRDIRTVAVIGVGTMGAGIAGEFARAGCDVRLMDISDVLLERGWAILDAAQDALVQAKLLTKAEAAAARRRIHATTSLERACAGAQLLVEAVAEQLPLKRAMFRKFEALCPKTAILATNTSGLSVTKIASAVKRPGRVAGLHFWTPPPLIPLVEVVCGRKTSAATANLLLDVCRRLGKRPILIRREVPGFVGNRLQFAVLREALHLLRKGVASAADIDTAMTAGPGLRWGVIGPLRTADLGGLDVFHAISSYLFADLAADRKPAGRLEELVRRGKYGAKTGEGFYRYGGEERQKTIARRDRVLLKFLKALREEAGRHEG